MYHYCSLRQCLLTCGFYPVSSCLLLGTHHLKIPQNEVAPYPCHSPQSQKQLEASEICVGMCMVEVAQDLFLYK